MPITSYWRALSMGSKKNACIALIFPTPPTGKHQLCMIYFARKEKVKYFLYSPLYISDFSSPAKVQH